MDRLRRCAGCGASELDTYISKSLQCESCAVERSAAQTRRVFALSRAHQFDPVDSLSAAIAKSAAMLQESYEEARARRAIAQAARDARRAAERIPVRKPRRKT